MFKWLYVARDVGWIRRQAAMSAVKQGCGANKTVRQHIVEEQGGYCLDAARVEEQLRYDSPDDTTCGLLATWTRLSEFGGCGYDYDYCYRPSSVVCLSVCLLH